ncbi:putative zinc-binding protein [Acidobacteriota bacterium]
MAEEKKGCACENGVTLIFPCSGAADVGEISDRAARRMTSTGIGKMFCLAGIGGNISGMIESAKGADKVLAIDGCALDCARKTLEEKSIEGFSHLRVTDTGLEKGKSPATDQHVAAVVEAGRRLLN